MGGGVQAALARPALATCTNGVRKRAGSGVPAAGSRGTGGAREKGVRIPRSEAQRGAALAARGAVGAAQDRSRHCGVTTEPPPGPSAAASAWHFGTSPAWLIPVLLDWKAAPGRGAGQGRGLG